ncbi:MAG: NADH-quinone oxidoreductase subunit I [Myxococcales bacterium]|nr:NADH-quinone oxidoreductase subunit I [Myxococcales bacterium]
MTATTKIIRKPARTLADQSYLLEVVKGLGVTLKHFFKGTAQLVSGNRPDPVKEPYAEGVATIEYPDEKRPYARRWRGVHRLTHREDGSPRCVACLCCSTACPAQCIYIKPAEYPLDDARRGYERYPEEFVIDELRCIFCGFCVEACPCDAIRMDTGLHMTALDNRASFIFDKAMLMSFPSQDNTFLSENPRHEPGDESHPGIDRVRGGH